MQVTDFSKKITSKLLNENLAKNFGCQLNLKKFNESQLRDVRNKLRTELSQFEINESYDNLHNNQKYQRTRALLDVINEEIFEREMTSAEKAKEKKLKKKVDSSDTKSSMQKQYGPEKGKDVYFATIRKRAMDESIPESWVDSALQRINIKESDSSELKSELKLRYDLTESKASWVLCEGEETKAEIIMATRDMVDRITGWLEDVAAMKAEQFLELVDTISAEIGSDVAQQYQNIVKPTLESIYTTLESSRKELTQGLSIVSGDEAVGSTDEIPTIGSPNTSEPSPMTEPVEPEVGREKRESVEYSRRLGQLLSSKKK